MRQQGQTTERPARIRDYPEPPLFPDDLSKTSLAAYRSAQADWWAKLKALLRQQDEDIENLIE